MTKWLTSLFLTLTFAASVLAGAQLHAGEGKMMKCCDKARSHERSAEVRAAQLCCLFNCSDSAPTSSNTSFNAAPSADIVSESISRQIADFFDSKPVFTDITSKYLTVVPTSVPQHRYIQHHSLLI